MFLITSKTSNGYGILDTEDGITEVHDIPFIKSVLRQGINIRGCNISNGELKIACHSDSVIKDFLQDTLTLLSKYKLLGVEDRKIQLDKIYNISVKYGFCDSVDDLSIDTDRNVVIFHKFGLVIPYENSDNYTIHSQIDVCDDNVISLSRLGERAFDYITMKIGNKVYTLKELLVYLGSIHGGFMYEYVCYIGITPSNKLFKIITTYRGVPLCFSVKFDTYANLEKQADRILNARVDTVIGYKSYVRNMLTKKPAKNTLVVTKISEKPHRGSSVGTYEYIKGKYPTLKDVYYGGF